MHVMFIHPNFPAQFGHIATYLTTKKGWKCTFITSIDTTKMAVPFAHCNYKVKPGPQPKVFYNPATLQEMMDHMAAIYRGLRQASQIRPDLVVGHMSYGTMLYLKNLYRCPFLGYFELLPPAFWTDSLALRPDFPPTENARLSNATFHTFTYLHLHMVDAAYTPTHFQLTTAPAELQHKIRVIFDGIDTQFFQPRQHARPVTFRGVSIPAGCKVVTYVSRGLESSRGFDIFMKVAKKLCSLRDDVVFLVAGEERTNYGHEAPHIGDLTFKQWVLKQDTYDLSRIHFLGRIPLPELATLYQLSDLHFYLTTPFVLSWSLVQSMASGCPILGSATAPVMEAIEDGVHGLLAPFYDVDALTQAALQTLNDPVAAKARGLRARERVLDRYESGKCIDQLVSYFEEVAGSKSK